MASICVRVLGCLFISHFYCGNETGSPVGSSYLLFTCCSPLPPSSTCPYSHDPSLHSNPTTGPSVSHNWVSRSISSAPPWCQRHMAAEHRSERARDAHMSPWPVSVATLSRISLATTRKCRWTLMVIHQREVFSLSSPCSAHKQTMVQVMATVGKLWCDLWRGSASYRLSFHRAR